MVLYEYPFNEGIRTMLRLEHLFDRLGQLVARDMAVDHHFALVTIFEIMDVASRADLKSDLLKELDRHRGQLQAFRGHPGVVESVLDGVIGRIRGAITAYNLTAADLGFGGKAKKAAGKAAAPAKRGKGKASAAKSPTEVKFQNDSGGTWGGRGKRPQWLRDAINSGKQLSDFAVKK